LKINTNTNTETHINLSAHDDVYKKYLEDEDKAKVDMPKEIGAKDDGNNVSTPQSVKETNPYEGADKSHQNIDLFHVIYKIDNREFEDRIPSNLTLKIYDTDFRKQALTGEWMSNLHNSVVTIKFSDNNKRKLDLAVNNEVECEEQEYLLDDKILKLGVNSDCIVNLILESYKGRTDKIDERKQPS